MHSPGDAGSTLALLNDYQRDFPLQPRPFAAIGQQLGLQERTVIAQLQQLRDAGQVGRIGAVWGRGAGGAAALCALSVPPARLLQVAAIVSREPAVNHNYEREHAWNLWYVLTGTDALAVRATAARIAHAAGVPALFLPMERAYRVDLGFDLRGAHALPRTGALHVDASQAVQPADRPLAALAEAGLPLEPAPFDAWARELGRPREMLLWTLRRWLRHGTLRRFGVVVRHHDVGFAANAMTVIAAPPDEADAIGMALAAQPGVTLAYRRATALHWPYNLYFMVHGRERAGAQALVTAALAATGAQRLPHETLFSVRRFKQTGGRYFAAAVREEARP
ncbi:Lrp/AsnC family transcriptional regulator [Ramlibacter sp. USB13]|uniref:siroheme decarboxylase n=1 Tax=Ramlibacter cellulosilyticus TaxID=2764187 RepID=A0A923MXQ8_9BURK|nr:Lrp/AsnC family transcriptional regulator [Ramlibacter cellulosilyticus]MBC5785632.1 Lrp/AsnC family transcriptional regulator [Ramlibacter cellulosilyticus]